MVHCGDGGEPTAALLKDAALLREKRGVDGSGGGSVIDIARYSDMHEDPQLVPRVEGTAMYYLSPRGARHLRGGIRALHQGAP